MRVATSSTLSIVAVLAGTLGINSPSFAQQSLNTSKIIALSWTEPNTLITNPIGIVSVSRSDYFARFAPVEWSNAMSNLYSNKIESPRLFPVWNPDF